MFVAKFLKGIVVLRPLIAVVTVITLHNSVILKIDFLQHVSSFGCQGTPLVLLQEFKLGSLIRNPLT